MCVLEGRAWEQSNTVEPPLTDPPRCGQPPYNGQHDRHRLILACVLYIFNLRETDNCNLSVPDNGHSARPRMIVAVQKKPLRADRLKATPSRTREGVAPRVYRGYYGVVSTFYSLGQVGMATEMLKQQSVECA